MKNIGPPSARSALKSNFPRNDRSWGIFSHNARVTLHQQLCRDFYGNLEFKNLKLYLKGGRQYAKTTGTKRPCHYRKSGEVWARVR